MHLAVNHPNPAQRLTPYEALLMRTRNAAWLGFDERERGTLAPGKRADFTLLDADPLTIPPQSIGDIRVTGLYLRAAPHTPAGRRRGPRDPQGAGRRQVPQVSRSILLKGGRFP